VQFPVGRIARLLKEGKYAIRVEADAPVFLAAVLEYLSAEILELAGNAAHDKEKSRIVPCHIELAVRDDEELSKLLGKAPIASRGVRLAVRDDEGLSKLLGSVTIASEVLPRKISEKEE